jgi:hypothetical protein
MLRKSQFTAKVGGSSVHTKRSRSGLVASPRIAPFFAALVAAISPLSDAGQAIRQRKLSLTNDRVELAVGQVIKTNYHIITIEPDFVAKNVMEMIGFRYTLHMVCWQPWLFSIDRAILIESVCCDIDGCIIVCEGVRGRNGMVNIMHYNVRCRA